MITVPPTQVALWVCPVADLGGVARHFLDVAKTGIPGWQVVFLVPKGPLADALNQLNADVIQADFGVGAGLPTSVRALRRAVKTRGVKLVHTHLAYADIVLAVTPLPRGVKRISSEHGIADPEIYQSSAVKARLMKAVHRWRTSRFDRLIAVSKSTKDVMTKHWRPKTEITLLYNGVDAPDLAGVAADAAEVVQAIGQGGLATRVLSLSRLSHEKRIGELLRGFKHYLQVQPAAVLTIAGTGPDEDALRDEAKKLGIWNSVSFVGYVDSQLAMVQNQVLVQLSKWENCSYTLVDARVRGLGIVATRVGGNPEVVPAGSLIDELNPEAIAAAIAAQSEGNPNLGWPSTAQMCDEIAALYREVVQL